jgi:hypothetical protein
MGKTTEKILLGAICATGLTLSGCTHSAGSYPVHFVDRSAVFSENEEPSPLRLVIEISENGKLTLNKIEAGTLRDTTFLSEKLKTIFTDRQKAAISAREVIILPGDRIEIEELEKLIEDLRISEAAPILVIKDYR